MGKKTKEFKTGDFIFAKVKGYPAWPARVRKVNGKKYFVHFYGTGEIANLTANALFDYVQSKESFLRKTFKRKDFNEGVKQIEYDFANNVPVEDVFGPLESEYESLKEPLPSENTQVPTVEQECAEGPRTSSAYARAGEVKEEPPDAFVDENWVYGAGVGMQSLAMLSAVECSEDEDEAPKPLIDIVKCEPTLVQTPEDGLRLRPTYASAPASTAPSAEALAAAVSATGHRNEPSELIKARKRMKLKYSCDVCNKMFSNKKALGQHKRIHQIHECEVCKKTFSWKNNLQRHKKLHSKLVKWKCDVCKKVFSTKDYLKTHMNYHSKLLKWECDVCHTVLYSKSNFKRHVNMHFKLGTTTKTNLKWHNNGQSKFVKWQCDVCLQVLSCKNTLQWHMNGHSKLVKWECDVCHKVFTRKFDLVRHINEHFQLVKWKCDVCHKVFSRKEVFKIHINIHSKREKWECDVCHKVFYRKEIFKIHNNTHSKREKWECDSCHMVFYIKSSLKGHINKQICAV